MLKIDNFHKIIIANWKLNGSSIFVEKYLKKIRFECNNDKHKCVIICPPFSLINQIKSNNLLIGAQDCSVYKEGAYTGEISSKILKDAGCQFCIVGHSERRSLFFENNKLISKKMDNCFEEQIVPILCVGESLEQKQNHRTKDTLINQIQNCISDKANKNNTIIAYEPVWAIGTGLTPTVAEINEIHAFIKNNIPQSKDFKILYGGSVKSSNCKEILAQTNVDGVLVGNSSIEIDEFNKIIES